jgi:hypothetical protein
LTTAESTPHSAPASAKAPAGQALKWYAVGAVLGLLALAAWWTTTGAPAITLDLADHLNRATQRRPSPAAFRVIDATLAGQSLKAIYVAEPSRLIWEDVLPEKAWLQVSLGVREEAWVREGSGVLFMVGVSLNGQYQELVSLIVNPFANAADRQWLPLLLDLSPWAGQRVELVLNTRVAHPEATAANHLALWGAPAIVTR